MRHGGTGQEPVLLPGAESRERSIENDREVQCVVLVSAADLAVYGSAHKLVVRIDVDVAVERAIDAAACIDNQRAFG